MNKRYIIEHLVDKLGLYEAKGTKKRTNDTLDMTKGVNQQTAALTDPVYKALVLRDRDKQEAERKRRERERDGPPIRNKYNPYEMTRRELKMDILRQAIGLGPKKPPKTELKTVWRPRPQNPPRYTYR